jgi:hypothetical protein
VPTAFAFTAAELPSGLVPEWNAPNTAGILVDGQRCDGPEKGARPLAGHQWIWAGRQGSASGLAVSLTVTRWSEGAAAVAFTAAIDETGYCKWQDPQTPRTPVGVSAKQTYASTSDLNGQHLARTMLRVGDSIVGIQVRNPKTSAAAAQLADNLAKIETARLSKIAP